MQVAAGPDSGCARLYFISPNTLARPVRSLGVKTLKLSTASVFFSFSFIASTRSCSTLRLLSSAVMGQILDVLRCALLPEHLRNVCEVTGRENAISSFSVILFAAYQIEVALPVVCSVHHVEILSQGSQLVIKKK